MPAYTVKQVARMAHVTVRTLHYYDQIGLLEPASRSAAGYRLYGRDELLRLQQILLYRELDLPLAEIGRILDDPAFDAVSALREHRGKLERRMERLGRLLHTIDRTIGELTEDDMTLCDKELYEGLTPEQAERYPRQAREAYGSEVVEATEERLRKLSAEEWRALRAEGEEITRGLAERADRPPDDAEVQELVARHHAHIRRFWPATVEAYAGLGQLYAEHDEFRAYYERFRPGLAEFMRAAITYYAEHRPPDDE